MAAVLPLSYNTDQGRRGGLCTSLRAYLCLLVSSTVLFSGQPRTFVHVLAGSHARERGKVPSWTDDLKPHVCLRITKQLMFDAKCSEEDWG